MPRAILDTGDDKKAIEFVLDQLVCPEDFLATVKDLYLKTTEVSYDILKFRDGRIFERYSKPQLINGGSAGRVWSFREITERMKSEETLRKSELNLSLKNTELEQKNLEMEQFVYIASHDLQEPLRTTSSFVKLLQKQYHGRFDEKADVYFKYLLEASERMKELIQNLLEYSRIGNKKELEQVNCNVVLQDVLADLDMAIKETGADIQYDSLPVINGYSTELKQLFQNLIANAIKFRKKETGPEINITVQKKESYWQFAFEDNGIGIAENHNEKIFAIFQRLHTRSEYEGSGIGLSHCKKIVELHHGKIWVESTPNKGSTFYFTIYSPKEKTHEPKIKMHHAD